MPAWTFAELGRQVDEAGIAFARASDYIKTVDPAVFAAGIRVTHADAHHGNGSQQLMNKLQQVVIDQLGDLLTTTLASMEREATEARALVVASLEAGQLLNPAPPPSIANATPARARGGASAAPPR